MLKTASPAELSPFSNPIALSSVRILQKSLKSPGNSELKDPIHSQLFKLPRQSSMNDAVCGS